MKGFLVDTNVLSELVRPKPEHKVTKWLAAQELDHLFVIAVTFGELQRGIELRDRGRRTAELSEWLQNELPALFRGRILKLSRPIALKWGTIAARRQKAGRPLGAVDGQIAATALDHDLAVATRNVSDFQDLGLDILNPWSA